MKQQDLEQQPHSFDTKSSVHVRNGNLYLEASLYKKYFPDLQSAILMKKDKTLFILPVVNAHAGGLLMKIRNAQGDRVIHAQEFFRDHGIDEHLDQLAPVSWDSTSSGLAVHLPGQK